MGIMGNMGNMGNIEKEAKRAEGESLSSFDVWFRHPDNGCLTDERFREITFKRMPSEESVRRLLSDDGFWRSGGVPVCDECKSGYRLVFNSKGLAIREVMVNEVAV